MSNKAFTVRELITELEKLNPDLQVIFYSNFIEDWDGIFQTGEFEADAEELADCKGSSVSEELSGKFAVLGRW